MTPAVLDASKPQEVAYCVPLWARDENMRLSQARIKARLTQTHDLRTDPIAVVNFGPSLQDTWEQIKGFSYVISCSGSHAFLVARGIVPTWHVEVDPRKHKADLIGPPQRDTEYLIASACHQKVFDHLEGYKVTLWHSFDATDEGQRALPAGEWAITGGCSVGLRAMTIARFLGFKDLHIFGMDGCFKGTDSHASAHPNAPKKSGPCVYGGVTYQTTPAMLEVARGTFHELDQMPDVKATFYGDGLVQAMAKDYTPKPTSTPLIAFNKPSPVSPEYRALNEQLHREQVAYGVGGGKYADTVKKLVDCIKTPYPSVLDFGCGKGYLAKELPFPIWEYDPCVPGKDEFPRPADVVLCTDVLEHVEPDRLMWTLGELRRVVRQVGYFVIHTGPAQKTLSDGRNAHLIQQNAVWWTERLSEYFSVGKVTQKGPLVHVVVGPHPERRKALASLIPHTTAGVRFNFDHLEMRRDPYPIGRLSNVLDPGTYATLAASFPPASLFKAFGGEGKKLSLSTRNNPNEYAAFLAEHDEWRAFHKVVKDKAFVAQVREVCAKQGIDIPGNLKTRWEFSILPADGGGLHPHTDLASKVVTIVISMRQESDVWDAAWGGGTDVYRSKYGETNAGDHGAPFERFDVVDSLPYDVNAGVLFIKSDNSWHGVSPIKGPAGAMRKSVTINLERV